MSGTGKDGGKKTNRREGAKSGEAIASKASAAAAKAGLDAPKKVADYFAAVELNLDKIPSAQALNRIVQSANEKGLEIPAELQGLIDIKLATFSGETVAKENAAKTTESPKAQTNTETAKSEATRPTKLDKSGNIDLSTITKTHQVAELSPAQATELLDYLSNDLQIERRESLSLFKSIDAKISEASLPEHLQNIAPSQAAIARTVKKEEFDQLKTSHNEALTSPSSETNLLKVAGKKAMLGIEGYIPGYHIQSETRNLKPAQPSFLKSIYMDFRSESAQLAIAQKSLEKHKDVTWKKEKNLRDLDKTYRAERADVSNDIIYLAALEHNYKIATGEKTGEYLDLSKPEHLIHEVSQINNGEFLTFTGSRDGQPGRSDPALVYRKTEVTVEGSKSDTPETITKIDISNLPSNVWNADGWNKDGQDAIDAAVVAVTKGENKKENKDSYKQYADNHIPALITSRLMFAPARIVNAIGKKYPKLSGLVVGIMTFGGVYSNIQEADKEIAKEAEGKDDRVANVEKGGEDETSRYWKITKKSAADLGTVATWLTSPTLIFRGIYHRETLIEEAKDGARPVINAIDYLGDLTIKDEDKEQAPKPTKDVLEKIEGKPSKSSREKLEDILNKESNLAKPGSSFVAAHEIRSAEESQETTRSV